MSRAHHLGDLQLAIMRVLWEEGEATVNQVHEALRDRGLAFSTFATMLRKMEKKGVCDHRTEGRQFVYRPLVSESEVQRSMVSSLTDQLFAGDSAALVSHLLREREIDDAELRTLVERLARRADGDPADGNSANGGREEEA